MNPKLNKYKYRARKIFNNFKEILIINQNNKNQKT